MAQEFDFLEIVKRIRVLSMLTNAIFASKQAIFVGYADRFSINVDKDGKLVKSKREELQSIEELTEILKDFNPVDNKSD